MHWNRISQHGFPGSANPGSHENHKQSCVRVSVSTHLSAEGPQTSPDSLSCQRPGPPDGEVKVGVKILYLSSLKKHLLTLSF